MHIRIIDAFSAPLYMVIVSASPAALTVLEGTLHHYTG